MQGAATGGFRWIGGAVAAARFAVRLDRGRGLRAVYSTRVFRLFLIGFLLSVAAAAGPPELTSIARIGGAPGETFEAVVRGKNLAGAARLWSPSAGLTGEVVGVEAAEDKKGVDRLRVRLSLAADLELGAHDLRVITPHGLSNALRTLAHESPAFREQDEPHERAVDAQPIAAWPAAVHGRISEVGEVDFYSFRVEAGDELLFRTFSSPALDPGLEIYELTGSWFDPERPTRLAFADEPVEYPGEPVETVLRHRFERAGEYRLRVNGFWGHGGADHIYVVLIDRAPEKTPEWPPAAPTPLWTERDWRRPVRADRLDRLAARTIVEPPPAVARVDADAEIYALPAEPPEIAVPTLITGSIESPGDVDRFRFRVAEGDRLVFEIETPADSLPQFNPLLRIFDSDGVEALTNIWSRVNSNGNVSKQIYPKTEYVFPREGSFTLEIRDITVSYGGPRMEYAVLVRPWMPHLGEVTLSAERLNLVAGEAASLNVTIDQEEGYDGLAVVTLEGLPEGVVAVTGADVDPDSPPAFNEGKKERFTTKSQKTTFALLTADNAPVTAEPVTARVWVRPAVDGKLGGEILAGEVLVMVTSPPLTEAR